jgi:MAP/microtubule affinity-regulating kinase
MNVTVCECTAGGIPLEFPMIIGRYTYVRTLGSGSSCVVVEVTHCNTHEHFACKVVSRIALTEAGEFGFFEQELRVHAFLNHPNIVQIHEVIFDPNLVFVILDLCSGGDLLSFIQSHQKAYPSTYRPLIIQLFSALDYLHSRGIAHRDIKPENILLTSSHQLKLADFGCCEVTSFGNEPNASGTVFYAAPEIFLKTGGVGVKSDIWSCGVLLYTMFSGHLPWKDGDTDEIVDQIVHLQFSSAFAVPREAKPIFDKCTRLDPRERPTASELLQDEWLQKEPHNSAHSHRSRRHSDTLEFCESGAMRKVVLLSRAQNGKRPQRTKQCRGKLGHSLSQPYGNSFHFGPNLEV